MTKASLMEGCKPDEQRDDPWCRVHNKKWGTCTPSPQDEIGELIVDLKMCAKNEHCLCAKAAAALERMEKESAAHIANAEHCYGEWKKAQETIAALRSEIAEMKKKDWDLENDVLLRRNDELRSAIKRAIGSGAHEHWLMVEFLKDALGNSGDEK